MVGVNVWGKLSLVGVNVWGDLSLVGVNVWGATTDSCVGVLVVLGAFEGSSVFVGFIVRDGFDVGLNVGS